MTDHDTLTETICKGIVGIGSPFLGIITASQEQIEWWLKIVSLVVGISVGVITGISICRRSKK